uniref:Protein kinase domain-containing protein n=1 Tax=Steinernema glaseri TaxID=37863 RepID=A0A1I7YHR4_9BILA
MPDGTIFALKILDIEEQQSGLKELRAHQRLHHHQNVLRCIAGKETYSG